MGDRVSTAYAFVALLMVDLVVKVAGFKRFHRLVRRFPVLGAGKGSSLGTAKICSAVDRAASLYFKKAWCLQRSATTACLLRLRGVDAELVIAARRMPFSAHAWVELNGEVLNDSPVVQNRFIVLERC